MSAIRCMSGAAVFRAVCMALVVSAALAVSGCELSKNQLTYDRAGELDRQDYRDAFAPVPFSEDEAANIPDFAPVVATPEELSLPTPLVTVAVNNTIGLRDLLYELAEQADVDLELDPQIRGSLIFTAKDRPFDEVVSRIADLAGLRYTFEKNVLRVEVDRPYIRNYDLSYINMTRTATSSMRTSVSTGGGDSSSGATTSGGSSSSIQADYDVDIWQEMQGNLEQILTSSDLYTPLATLTDPLVTPVSTLPMAEDPSQPPALPGAPQVGQMDPAVAPVLQVAPGDVDPVVPNAPATFSISRQSGMLSVFANDRQHRAVKTYLDEFRNRLTTQVLIEAKVLQVELTDEYSAGIQWDDIRLFGDGARLSASFPSPGLSPQTSGSISFVYNSGDLNSVVNAISRFGTVRALSSPRITVLNNQPALINVAQNNVYFAFSVETEDNADTDRTRITIDSEQRSAPEGIVMSVLPAANPNTGEILLSLRPTISRITNTVSDPTIAFSLVSLGVDPSDPNIPRNNIPQMAVQEIDSMLKLQSGQVVVMGGLMRDTNSVTQESFPVLGDLPLVGNLFRSTTDLVEKSELVILIRATIVSGSNVDDTDRRFMRTFGNDRRPSRL